MPCSVIWKQSSLFQGASGSMQQPGETTLLEFVRDDPRKLRAELESANKKMEKILAAFKKTSREFRQAVYCLTGPTDNTNRLSNTNRCMKSRSVLITKRVS